MRDSRHHGVRVGGAAVHDSLTFTAAAVAADPVLISEQDPTLITENAVANTAPHRITVAATSTMTATAHHTVQALRTSALPAANA